MQGGQPASLIQGGWWEQPITVNSLNKLMLFQMEGRRYICVPSCQLPAGSLPSNAGVLRLIYSFGYMKTFCWNKTHCFRNPTIVGWFLPAGCMSSSGNLWASLPVLERLAGLPAQEEGPGLCLSNNCISDMMILQNHVNHKKIVNFLFICVIFYFFIFILFLVMSRKSIFFLKTQLADQLGRKTRVRVLPKT